MIVIEVAQREQQRRAVQHRQRRSRDVEGEDVGQAEYQAGDADRHRRDEIDDLGRPRRQPADAIDQREQQEGAEASGQDGDQQRGPQRRIAAAQGDVIVLEREGQPVRPQTHEARIDDDADDGEHRKRRKARDDGQRHVARRDEAQLRRHRALGAAPELALRGDALDVDGDAGRREQQQADNGADAELHLPRDLVVDLGREHRIVAADHGGIAEIGDSHSEHDEAGAEQAELHVRQGDVEELPPASGAHHLGGVVVARIGMGERGFQNQHRLRQRVEHVGDQEARQAVDVDALAEHAADQAVAPEQEDQAEPEHKRRRQHWQRQHRGDDARSGYAGPRHRISEHEAEHEADGGRGKPECQAVEGRLEDAGRARQRNIVGKANAAVIGNQAAPQHHGEREDEEDQQREAWQRDGRCDQQAVIAGAAQAKATGLGDLDGGDAHARTQPQPAASTDTATAAPGATPSTWPVCTISSRPFQATRVRLMLPRKVTSSTLASPASRG